jgi:diketogulonate reductase-like aldo/keto reductase
MVIKLNNGIDMPALGLGVLGRDHPELVSSSVETAIKSGYRLIDTAAAYGNERQVGEGIRNSGIQRNELFVTTKLWLSDYGYESTQRACDVSLKKLGLEYIDLYLLHWPVPHDFYKTLDSYLAAEKLLKEGKVRAIGVCNFTELHLNTLVHNTSVIPSVNQIELHPRYVQKSAQLFHQKLGITTQAWSPIGGSVRRANETDPLTDPAIKAIAAKYNKTPSQVILRWHLDNGISAIPKSFTPNRIIENFDVFDFSLTPHERLLINSLDTGLRSGPNPEDVDISTFPITVDD